MSDTYTVQFYCSDKSGKPYVRTKYTVYLGNNVMKKGKTDNEGYTPIFSAEKIEEISLHLEIPTHCLNVDV